jgi:hypothetical protein
MKEVQSVLKLVSDGLKTIAQGVEAISEKVDELARSQTAGKPKAAAKAKAKKPASAAPRMKASRKTSAKPTKKKAAKAPIAAKTVLKIISRSKKGVDTKTLMKKTGYDRKKISNVIYNLGKQGQIKSVEKGVYVKS